MKKEEYKLLFNKELIINVENKEVDVQEELKKLIGKHKLNFDKFLLKKNNRSLIKSSNFIKEYGQLLFNNGLSFKEYAPLINRDRTTIMYHLKK